MIKHFKKPFFLLIFGVSISSFSHPGNIIKRFQSPGCFPSGLAFDGQYLWMADHLKDKLICIDPKSGKVSREIDSPAFWPVGLTWDGQNLWNVDQKEKKIYQIEPKNGIILKSIYTPCNHPEGLTWDGKTLWISDSQSDVIIKIDLSDGTAITTLTAPSRDTQGLAFDSKYLWSADRKTDEIFMIDPDCGEVIATLKSPGPYPRGLTWDGSTLWNVDFQTDSLYQLVRNDGETYSLINTRSARLTFHHEVKMDGKGQLKNLNLYIAVPKNQLQQEILDLKWTPAYNRTIFDQWDQQLAHFIYQNIGSDSIISTKMQITAKVSEIQYYIFPEIVGSLDEIPPKIRKMYTADGSKYQIHDTVIQNLIRQVVGRETNPYWIARKIYNFIGQKLEYHYEGGWNAAPVVLERGTGSCSEYTFSFIALCRAAGLPARYIGAIVVRGDDASLDELFHRWAEVYLPNYGWIPVDPQGGDKPLPRDRALGIGNLSNRFLITTQGGGDSKVLGWYYIWNENYEVEPKVHVNIEAFGEWEPLKD